MDSCCYLDQTEVQIWVMSLPSKSACRVRSTQGVFSVSHHPPLCTSPPFSKCILQSILPLSELFIAWEHLSRVAHVVQTDVSKLGTSFAATQ